MTFPDEPFSSYFSGNTVQICPVGALTAKPYRFKARPWDLSQVESTCTTCSVGCRTVVQSSRDELLRYQGVDSDPVNWSWLCDRGRFNFESVNSDQRLIEPMVRGEGGLAATSWSAALEVTAQLFDAALDAGGPRASPSSAALAGSNESAFAWAQLADALGLSNRDAQLADGLPAGLLDLPRATIDEAAPAATVVLLGPDLKEELPVLYLRLRHAAEHRTTRLVEISPTDTGLTRYAWRSIRAESAARTVIANALAGGEIREQLASGPVVVVAGRANLAESEASAASTLRAVLEAVPGPRSCPPCVAATSSARSNSVCAPPPRARSAPGSSRPPPPGASSCSCCSAPTRWPTPRRRPRPPGPRRRPPGRLPRHVPHPAVDREGRRRARRRRRTPSRTARRPTSKVASRPVPAR